MKIVINSGNSPAEDMTVYIKDGKRISQPTAGIYSHYWDESDLSKLLTEKQMKDLETGKYEFEIPAWKVNLLTGKSGVTTGPKQREQLLFISQW